MSLETRTFISGQLQNNVYVVFDQHTLDAVVIDPTRADAHMLQFISENNLSLQQIWITHAHFDHISGVTGLINRFGLISAVTLHKLDVPLWESGGGAKEFGIDFKAGQTPNHLLSNNDMLMLGTHQIHVLHTPGHSPGHVTYHSPDLGVAFCGDLIFYHGIGRTDFKDGDYDVLLESIRTKIFHLPKETKLLPGHGLSTTVQEEITSNLFI